MIDGVAIIPKNPKFAIVKQSRVGKIYICKLEQLMGDLAKSTVRSALNSFREITFTPFTSLQYHPTMVDYTYPMVQDSILACGDDTGDVWIYDLDRLPLDGSEPPAKDFPPAAHLDYPNVSNPKYKQKKIIDENKQVRW